MATSSHDTTQIKDIAYRLAPPPIKDGTQTTEYAVGDVLLIMYEMQRIAVISHVGTGKYGTIYAFRLYDTKGNSLKRSICGVGEKKLKALFISYVWWMV